MRLINKASIGFFIVLLSSASLGFASITLLMPPKIEKIKFDETLNLEKIQTKVLPSKKSAEDAFHLNLKVLREIQKSA